MKYELAPEKQLAHFFHRNGCLRLPNKDRQEEENYKTYKKGYEVRLVAKCQNELEDIRKLLNLTGFSTAKPFVKGHQFVQPIYGLRQVERFCILIGVAMKHQTPTKSRTL